MVHIIEDDARAMRQDGVRLANTAIRVLTVADGEVVDGWLQKRARSAVAGGNAQSGNSMRRVRMSLKELHARGE